MAQVRGRPFEPGNQMGRGRPAGSRNLNRLRAEDLLLEHADALIRKCVVMALQGDRVALRLCVERLCPTRRDAYVQLPLPPAKALSDVHQSVRRVLQAIASSKITPGEGEKLSNILENYRRAIETADLQERIEKLEAETANQHGKPG